MSHKGAFAVSLGHALPCEMAECVRTSGLVEQVYKKVPTP